MMDIVEDACNLTNLSKPKMSKIVNLFKLIIAYNMSLTDELIYNVDIGIGKISTFLNDGKVEYKFTPSGSFNKYVKDGYFNKCKVQKIMKEYVEDNSIKKLKKTYKDEL